MSSESWYKRHAGEGEQAAGQGERRYPLTEPQPGDHGGHEGAGGADDRNIGDAGELERGDEARHAESGEAGDQQARPARGAGHHQGAASIMGDDVEADEEPAEDPAPEQDGPGIERDEPGEESGEAPGH